MNVILLLRYLSSQIIFISIFSTLLSFTFSSHHACINLPIPNYYPSTFANCSTILPNLSSVLLTKYYFIDYISDCQMAGNGWSSGCTNYARKKKPYKGPCYACRRKSLSHGASVLPSGQLLMATNEQQENETASPDSSERCREESCTKCNQYDADDETDNHALDYDIINIKTLRLRNWLSTVKAFSDTELITSDDDCEPESHTIPEYDVISVPCLNSSVPSLSLQSALVKEQTKVINTAVSPESNQSDGSEYSVVHSTIGGLELGTSKQLYDSLSSLSSAGVYRTYDVVEMVEVL